MLLDWEYQDSQQGCHNWTHIIQHLLTGVQIVSNKLVKFDKLQEITKDLGKNPALFLDRLSEAPFKYIKLYQESPSRATFFGNLFYFPVSIYSSKSVSSNW